MRITEVQRSGSFVLPVFSVPRLTSIHLFVLAGDPVYPLSSVTRRKQNEHTSMKTTYAGPSRSPVRRSMHA